MKRQLLSRATAILIVACLSGCAMTTPYGPASESWKGGYENTKLADDQFNVAFYANGFTSPVRAKDYFLYRCAELTQQQGYDYFVVISGDMIVNYSVVGSGSGASTVSKPSYSGTIKLRKGKTPANNPNAYSAKEIIKNIGPEIERQ